MSEHEESGAAKIPASEPLEAEKLVEYADESIVSRTLIEKESGTVTAFAFDEGQSLSEHTTPFDALVHVLDGEAELTIGGERIRVPEGQMALMPASVPHSVAAPSQFKMLIVMLRG